MTDAVSSTLAERGARYGEFFDHAAIAQALQSTLRGAAGWAGLGCDMQQALTVICDKMARILNGDPTYLDNWHDIQGYARLVEERLEREERDAEPELPLPYYVRAFSRRHFRVCPACGHNSNPARGSRCSQCLEELR